MGAIRATPKAKDLPNPNRGDGNSGQYSELEVPGDYEVVLESWSDYKTSKSKGWKFEYSCETPSGGTVGFTVWIPQDQLWKVVQHFDALGSPSEEDQSRVYDPDEIVGRACGAAIDFPRDVLGNPTTKYREIRGVFPLPQDSEIEDLSDASTPEPVELPGDDEVEEL